MTVSTGNQLFNPEFSSIPGKRVLKASFVQEQWISFCVNAITRQFLNSTMILKKKADREGDEETVIRKHPALRYIMNSGTEPFAFFCPSIIADLVLTGEAFWWTGRDINDKKRLPSERVETVVEDNKVVRYKITDVDNYNKANLTLEPSEVMHIKMPNPFTPHVGLSLLVAASLPTLVHKYGMEYIVAFFLRGGTTSGIIETESNNADQLLKLAKTIMQAFGGRRNMHADKILPKGAKWSGQGNTFQQIRLIEMLQETRDSFKAATGCTNTVLGLVENVNKAVSDTEMELFWKMTILPLQTILCQSIMHSDIWKRFGLDPADYELAFDNSDIEYLDDFERRLEQDAKLMGTWTVNERRERLGKDSLGVEYDKLEKELGGATGDAGGGFADLFLSMGSKVAKEGEQTSQLDPLAEFKKTELGIQKPSKKAESIFNKEFGAWEKIVLDNLENPTAAYNEVKRRADSFAEKFVERVMPSVMAAYDNQISLQKKLKSYVRATKETQEDRAAKLEALKERAKSVLKGEVFAHQKDSFLGYSETAMKNIYGFIEEKLAEGLSLDQVASEVRTTFAEKYEIDEAYKGQAALIVKQEYASAISLGQQQVAKDLGTVSKKMAKSWVTMGDEFVRESHKECESQGPMSGRAKDVPDMEFVNGLRYPRDAKGSAGEVINCRCTVRYIVTEWE